MGHAQFLSSKTEWPFSVRPLTPHLGAEISGVNWNGIPMDLGNVSQDMPP